MRERGGHRLVPFADITLFSASEGLVYAETREGEHLTDYTLKELEERTAGSFVRINRSEIVNLERIARIESNGDGSASIALDDGRAVPGRPTQGGRSAQNSARIAIDNFKLRLMRFI